MITTQLHYFCRSSSGNQHHQKSIFSPSQRALWSPTLSRYLQPNLSLLMLSSASSWTTSQCHLFTISSRRSQRLVNWLFFLYTPIIKALKSNFHNHSNPNTASLQIGQTSVPSAMPSTWNFHPFKIYRLLAIVHTESSQTFSFSLVRYLVLWRNKYHDMYFDI